MLKYQMVCGSRGGGELMFKKMATVSKMNLNRTVLSQRKESGGERDNVSLFFPPPPPPVFCQLPLKQFKSNFYLKNSH